MWKRLREGWLLNLKVVKIFNNFTFDFREIIDQTLGHLVFWVCQLYVFNPKSTGPFGPDNTPSQKIYPDILGSWNLQGW